MIHINKTGYPAFDKPEICRLLFYPRRETAFMTRGNSERIEIPVAKDAVVGGWFHDAGKDAPTALFFHGNGEIASDYDDIGTLYRRMGINLFAVDYRGYGFSSGIPTVTTMMQDSHAIFLFTAAWLAERRYSGPLVVMGRSLGSAPALEISYLYCNLIGGLIIESGFAYILPLLKLLGVHDPELTEESGPQNLEKIRHVTKPTLIIHAEEDQIISISEGEALYAASGAKEKRFLRIAGADHNNIFHFGMDEYLNSLGGYFKRVATMLPMQ